MMPSICIWAPLIWVLFVRPAAAQQINYGVCSITVSGALTALR